MGFSRQEYWSGLPCPPPGIFLTQGSNPSLLCLLCLLHRQVGSLPLESPGKRVHVQLGQITKRPKTSNCHSEEQKTKAGCPEQSRVLPMPPAHSTTKGETDPQAMLPASPRAHSLPSPHLRNQLVPLPQQDSGQGDLLSVLLAPRWCSRDPN